MRENRLRSVLDQGDTAVCGWVSSNSPYAAEVLSHSGFDAVVIDLQHGMFGTDALVPLLQAVGSGPATPMVRVPALDAPVIGKALDAGAYGIVCPTIDSGEQAAALVRACRYPPTGERSYGPSRGLLYGGADYLDHADDTVLCWAMVESAAALDDLDAIVSTPGLDGIFVGPNDLALSLGERPGQLSAPPTTARALTRIAEAAHSAEKFIGGFALDADGARAMTGLGYQMVVPGNDIGILGSAAADRIATVRRSAGRESGGGY